MLSHRHGHCSQALHESGPEMIEIITHVVFNRQRLDLAWVEVSNTVYVIAERSSYPVRDLDLHAFGDDEVEIEATLAATSLDGDALDALTQRLAALPAVRQAFWSPSTTE